MRYIGLLAGIGVLLAAAGTAGAITTLASVDTPGRPDLLGTISTDGLNVYFNITAVGQADDGDALNPSKYYTASQFDNEYFTLDANGHFLKYNMFSGNTTPGWGTSWGDATAALPVEVTFSQTEVGDDFVYAVTIPLSELGIVWGDTFLVQIKARDFNDDYVQSYTGFVGNDGDYSHYNGLYITDTGKLSVQVVPEPVTMAGLMLGIGCLARYVRRRRAL